MQRAPARDTYPVDPGAEALIERLALGGRRPQPLTLPPAMQQRAEQRQAAPDRDRSEQMLAVLLLACSVGFAALVAFAAIFWPA